MERLRWTPWSQESQEVPFDPVDRRQNEGRGERKYLRELELSGVQGATLNTPGQNPDIIIPGELGVEIKELSRWSIRLSGATEVKFAVYDRLVEPNLHIAEKYFSSENLRKLKVLGYISQRPMKLLDRTGTLDLLKDIFHHSKINSIVIVDEKRGYMKLGIWELFCHFSVSRLNSFVPTMLMLPDSRPEK